METTLRTSFKEDANPVAYSLIDMSAWCVGDVVGDAFKKLYVTKEPEKVVKGWLHREGFSHRQAHGIIVEIKSRINSQAELQKADIVKCERKIRDFNKQLKSKTPVMPVKWLENQIAKWTRRKAKVEANLARDIPSFCFGSKKLFRQQHHLEENGLTFEQWQEAWSQHRHEQLLCVGSIGENRGNSECQVIEHHVEGTVKNPELHCVVQLKLPPCVCDSWVDIPLVFKYGADKLEPILQALETANDHCLAWRFIINRERRTVWAHVSFTELTLPARTVPDAVLGVDMNEDFLEASVVSRKTGNRIWFWRDEFKGKSAQETRDNLCKILGNYMALCQAMNWAFAYERLDFEGKKAKFLGARMNRMLSEWLTGHYSETIERNAARCGVLAVSVNPAFTSVIGDLKFSTGYGWSRHQGAAVAIARRAMGYSERARSVKPEATAELAKIRKPHVWGVWARAKPAARVGKSGKVVVPAAKAGSPKGMVAACGPSPPLGA